MSDDDFMQESDEDYDFEYEDDEDEDSGDVDIENKYYNAKQIKQSDPDEAIAEFLAIPGLEETKGEWGFKGLKQAIKLEFHHGKYAKVVEHYAELLTYVKSAVTRNYSEKSVNNMLDFIEKGAQDDESAKCVEQVYSLTLDSFQNSNNERLWLKTNIKLAKLLLDRKDYSSVAKKVKDLHKTCQREDGTDDPSKGTYSLEVYALEIQMHAATKNNKQLKRLYERALKVRSAVPHPKIMGIIRECGGKMHMSEENWDEAQKDFFESFRNYDEAGSLQRIQVLKYLLLTTMLMRSNINPFDSQETKPYKSDPNQGLDENHHPFDRVTLKWLAERLKISEEDVEDVLGFLIADGKLDARIDQQQRTVSFLSRADSERLKSLQEMADVVAHFANAVHRDNSNNGNRFELRDNKVLAPNTKRSYRLAGKTWYRYSPSS
ncbi:unnamed protein product [Parascedosporium putredinis]|uniref:PCI domain-containing protein n=1 Tax=Parascedosporium putredinis TaxID=1442378 RepID=A0A9P1M5Q4_9PEZI|nr:unnamed protein product [Parascedosporium putredinis]CAI7988314.1 unnamed protein product [Parascedosporium putredinis]